MKVIVVRHPNGNIWGIPLSRVLETFNRHAYAKNQPAITLEAETTLLHFAQREMDWGEVCPRKISLKRVTRDPNSITERQAQIVWKRSLLEIQTLSESLT